MRRPLILTLAITALFSLPHGLEAATLTVVPSSTNVTVGDTVRATIVVNSGGVAINNAEAILHFPTDLLHVTSISSASSIFSLWVEQPAFSNDLGQVTFNGGVPNPGFLGASGAVLTVAFRADGAGAAALMLSDEAVRANDGLGTDVFSSSSGTTINIRAAQPVVPTSPPTQPTSPAIQQPSTLPFTLTITSPTHPNQNAWYATSSADVQWALPPEATAIETLLSDTNGKTPTVLFNKPLTARHIDGLPEGTSYFTLRYKTPTAGWSTIASYRFNVDTVPPVLQDAQLTYNADNETLDIRAWAQDDRSGISRFEVVLDSKAPAVIQPNSLMGRTYSIAMTEPGTHTALLRVFDGAGNVSAPVETTFTVAPSPLKQTMFRIGSLRVSLLWLLLLLLLISLLSLGVAVEARYRLHHIKKHLKPSEEAVRKAVHRKMKMLESDLENIVKVLDTAEAHDALPTPEKRLRANLVSELDEVKGYLSEGKHLGTSNTPTTGDTTELS